MNKIHIKLLAFGCLILALGALPPKLAMCETLRAVSAYETAYTIENSAKTKKISIFAAIDGDYDVTATLIGPPSSMVVHKRDRALGMWLKSTAMNFDGVPTVYAMVSTLSWQSIKNNSLLRRLQIGIKNLQYSVRDAGEGNLKAQEEFFDAIVKKKVANKEFLHHMNSVSVTGGSLARADFFIPSSAPAGKYRVNMYFSANGQIIATSAIDIAISNSALDLIVKTIAFDYPRTYAVMSIIISILLSAVVNYVINSSRGLK